jgi:hypothetical protein
VVGLLAERGVGDAEELRGQLQQRRGDVPRAREVGGDPHVLVEQRQAEGAWEGARQDALGKEVHRRVAAPARDVDDVERHLRTHARALERGEPLRGAPDVDGEQGVVDRLERVARADRAAVHDLLAEGGEHGAGTLERGRVAADHHGERAALSADRAAADRGVEEADATRGQTGGDLARGRRVARGAVDQGRAGAHRRQEAGLAVEERGDLARGREAGHDELGIPGGRRRGGGARGARGARRRRRRPWLPFGSR